MVFGVDGSNGAGAYLGGGEGALAHVPPPHPPLEVKKICTNIQCKNMLKFEQLHV